MKNPEITNRREHVRLDVERIDIRGTIQLVNSFADIISPYGAIIDFQMIDFSALGYRVLVDVPLPEDSEIMIHFSGIGQIENFMLLNGDEFRDLNHVLLDDHDIDCLGLISWCQQPNETHGFHLGIQIREESLHHKFHALFSAIIDKHHERCASL